jgi:hypothetical protein
MKVLILASGVPVQYRVLRAAAEMCDFVLVAGNGSAAALRRSRFCKRYFNVSDGYFGSHTRTLDYLNRICQTESVDVVIPSDALTTRFLAENKDHFVCQTFPVPSVDAFDVLNNKWRFYNLCKSIGVPTPSSSLHQSKIELQSSIDTSSGRKLIAKPLCLYGSIGVSIIGTREDVAHIRYTPILVQEYVDGFDVDISVITKDGEVFVSCVYKKEHGRIRFLKLDNFEKYVAAIVSHLNLSGVYNFGSRMTHEGSVFMIECNPRFWHTMDYPLLAGLNFIEAVLLGERYRTDKYVHIVGKSIPTLKCAILNILKPWCLSRNDLERIFFAIKDPLPILMDSRVNSRARTVKQVGPPQYSEF